MKQVVEYSGQFTPEQLLWYHRVLRKDAFWTLVFFCAGVGYVANSPDLVLEPFNQTEWWRVVLNGIGAGIAWLTLYLDLYCQTPPLQNDVKWILLEKNWNGHYSYLTFHIIMLFVVYWSLSFVSELAWFLGYTEQPEHVWSRKLLRAVYSFSPVASALGISLSMLFFKFNYFESKWRTEVLEVYHSRGHVWFGTKVIFTHANQTPKSLLDVTVGKNRSALAAFSPGMSSLVLPIILFGLYFIVSTHINHYLTGQYPYPFLRGIMSSRKKECLFVMGITAFVLFLTQVVLLIAATSIVAVA